MPMDHDQARYAREDVYEPLLVEKDETTVEIGGGGVGEGDESTGDEDDGAVSAGDTPLPDELTRDELTLPSLSEPELARHYTRLSQMNWSIDSGPYPLGSCTMKYNPKFTEDVAALPAGAVHPDRSAASTQGTLELRARL
ncbi:glycine dehydrogenase subunit 2, partial [Halobium palmae]